MLIRKDDLVKIITGDNKGSTGKVIRVLADENKIVVQGANLVYRHVKPGPKNQKGGRISKEMPIHVSNVMLVSDPAGHEVRLGVRYLPDGTKERFCKKTGASLGSIGAAKPNRAKLATSAAAKSGS